VPVPVKLIKLGLSLAVLTIDSCADSEPSTVGLKATVTLAWAPAESVKGVVIGPRVKSPGLLPVRLTLETARGAVPVLVNVTVTGELVLSTC